MPWIWCSVVSFTLYMCTISLVILYVIKRSNKIFQRWDFLDNCYLIQTFWMSFACSLIHQQHHFTSVRQPLGIQLQENNSLNMHWFTCFFLLQLEVSKATSSSNLLILSGNEIMACLLHLILFQWKKLYIHWAACLNHWKVTYIACNAK